MDGSQRTGLCKLAEILVWHSFVISHSDEHQKRSPDCSFFTLYASIKPKTGRPKKSRASKASRMSTQSNVTAVSEAVSIAETEANLDETMISTANSVKPTKTAKGGPKASKSRRLASKAKGKATKTKEEEPQTASSFLEPEDDDFEVKVGPESAAVVSSNKRKSEEMSTTQDSHAELQTERNEVDSDLPPAKRRNTRARASVTQAQETPLSVSLDEDVLDTHMTDLKEISPPSAPIPKRKAKGSKKRASSTTRKASTTSTASKAPLRAVVPNDEEIDAALEADLARPLTDDEAEAGPIGIEQPKGRRLTRTKPGSKKATASVAPTRRGTRVSSMTVDEPPMVDIHPNSPAVAGEAAKPISKDRGESLENCEFNRSSPDAEDPKANTSRKAPGQRRNHDEYTKANVETLEESVAAVDETSPRPEAPISKSQNSRSRQAPRQLPTRNTRASNVPKTHDIVDPGSDVNSSMLDTQTVQDDSGHETDAGGLEQSRTKFPSKKPAVGKKKVQCGKKTAVAASNIEDVVQAPMDEIQQEQTEDAAAVAPNHVDIDRREVMDAALPEEEAKSAKATKPSKAKGKTARTKAAAKPAPVASSPEQSPVLMEIQNTPASPPPPSVHMTPRSVLSPQSSDAENQPPSSRLSTCRPPLSMPSSSNPQMTCIPLAATTPITSPSRGASSKLQSTLPWTAVDLRQVFNGTPSANKGSDPFAIGKVTGSAEDELTSPEKKLTVEQWIQFNAQRGEEKLRNECERLVGKFEDEGLGALRTLEGIVCTQ